MNKILQIYLTKKKDGIYDPDFMDLSVRDFNELALDSLVYMMDNKIPYDIQEYNALIISIKEQYPISAHYRIW